MKKNLLALGLALSLAALGACTPAAEKITPVPTPPMPTAPAFIFTRENLPRLDGSTSTIPLGQAVCSVLLGESREEVADLVQFSRTTESYWALIGGSADLLLAAEPEESVKTRMKEEGDKWLLTPFATDALAFIVSPDNPVDSITAAQARDIYAGKITNWSELGGKDEPIIAFQRNADAGSQVLLQKLVMGDTPLMTPPADYIPTMGGMMEAVREFDGSSGAIGYTVYYYANDMKMAEGLKILKIASVAPVAYSIRDGSYAFLNPYYVAIAKDAAEDSPTRILYNWLLGPEGQALIEHEGYVAVSPTKTEVHD